jgi:hypothetical protein
MTQETLCYLESVLNVVVALTRERVSEPEQERYLTEAMGYPVHLLSQNWPTTKLITLVRTWTERLRDEPHKLVPIRLREHDGILSVATGYRGAVRFQQRMEALNGNEKGSGQEEEAVQPKATSA